MATLYFDSKISYKNDLTSASAKEIEYVHARGNIIFNMHSLMERSRVNNTAGLRAFVTTVLLGKPVIGTVMF